MPSQIDVQRIAEDRFCVPPVPCGRGAGAHGDDLPCMCEHLASLKTADFNPCRDCAGEGYIEDVNDASADWIECKFCEGTGDRYGRGETKSNPMPEVGR